MAIKFGRPIEMRDTPRREATLSAPSLDLAIRPRRNRKAEWARRMVRENVLTTDDLIWPLFVSDGHNKRTAVASMPGVERLSVDQAVREAERAVKLDIPCIALFPYTDPNLRDEQGSEAVNSDNLVCQAVRAIKKEFPGLGVLCDVALDPYTSHGHDGLLRGRQDPQRRHRRGAGAAGAGAGGSRMRHHRAVGHDGRPRRRHPRGRWTRPDSSTCRSWPMRRNMPPPFMVRSVTRWVRRKRSPATSAPIRWTVANSDEALREVELDIAEGADMVMVKPGMPYLDILRRVKDTFGMPTFVYQVSGEYAMLMAAIGNGWLDGDRAMMESLTAFKRAGADGILTYFAPQAAERLKKGG